MAQLTSSCSTEQGYGTIVGEHIFHMAGATSPQLQTEAEMIKAIREAEPRCGAAQQVLRADQSPCGWHAAGNGS